LQLEVTSRCNLRCVHCYISDHHRPETPLPRLLELVREVAAEGCMSVSLTGGEVALRDGWLELAAEVKRLRMLLTILTNGTAFGPGELDQLISLRPSSVAVSIYGPNAEVHDQVTGGPGSFDRAVETLKRLRAAGIKCRVGCVLMPQTIDYFREIAALATGLGCQFMFDPTVTPCDDGSTDVLGLRVSAGRLVDFFVDDAIKGRSMEGRIADAKDPPAPRTVKNCDAGITMAFVDSRGDLFPCAGFPPALGNINGASFHAIWNGHVADEFREAMTRPLHGCSECDRQSFCFTRCPRLALLEDGDLSGPSTRACEMAQVTVEMCERIQAERRLSPTTSLER
jgi:radical SAM protein with 4Fe4S-binding SPASM domain